MFVIWFVLVNKYVNPKSFKKFTKYDVSLFIAGFKSQDHIPLYTSFIVTGMLPSYILRANSTAH